MKQFLKTVVLFGLCGFIVGIFLVATVRSKLDEIVPVIAVATGSFIGAIRATGQEVCEVIRSGLMKK
jgi:hypothetical protein